MSEKVAHRLQRSHQFIVSAANAAVQLRQERPVTPDGVRHQEGNDPTYKHFVPDGTFQTPSENAARGEDGAAALKLMKDKGAVTIVQDKESSVVHGMPGEAIKLDAATYVLPPEKMAAALSSLVKNRDQG